MEPLLTDILVGTEFGILTLNSTHFLAFPNPCYRLINFRKSLLFTNSDTNLNEILYDSRTVLLVRHKNTGKSLSEALILASTNPQYDNRLFNDF